MNRQSSLVPQATVTELADLMLDLAAFRFRPEDPVRWASGAIMPVYNDNRRLLSEPRARALVTDAFCAILGANDAGTPAATDVAGRAGVANLDGIVGTATGGIAPATSLADRLGLRFFYVRSRAKDHGLGRRVEGAGEDFRGMRVVLVEDLISTGGSSAAAALAVHEAGATLESGMAVFSYGFARADEAFAALPFSFTMTPILTVTDLYARARERDLLTAEQIALVETWLADPFGWAAKQGDSRG